MSRNLFHPNINPVLWYNLDVILVVDVAGHREVIERGEVEMECQINVKSSDGIPLEISFSESNAYVNAWVSLILVIRCPSDGIPLEIRLIKYVVIVWGEAELMPSCCAGVGKVVIVIVACKPKKH